MSKEKKIKFKLSIAEDFEHVKERTFDANVRAHGYEIDTSKPINRIEKTIRNQVVVTYKFHVK